MNCRPGPGEEGTMDTRLSEPDRDRSLGPQSTPTGDGVDWQHSACTVKRDTTKWDIFASSAPGGPVPGYSSNACEIPAREVALHTCTVAKKMSLDRAQALKNKGIKIYVIGLGTGNDIDSAFLTQLSSGTDFTFITPNKSDLQSIFNAIAKDIKLRLVQ